MVGVTPKQDCLVGKKEFSTLPPLAYRKTVLGAAQTEQHQPANLPV